MFTSKKFYDARNYEESFGVYTSTYTTYKDQSGKKYKS
jgi:hypothetical protein